MLANTFAYPNAMLAVYKTASPHTISRSRINRDLLPLCRSLILSAVRCKYSQHIGFNVFDFGCIFLNAVKHIFDMLTVDF